MSHVAVNRILTELLHNETDVLYSFNYAQTDISFYVIVTTEGSSLNSYVSVCFQLTTKLN